MEEAERKNWKPRRNDKMGDRNCERPGKKIEMKEKKRVKIIVHREVCIIKDGGKDIGKGVVITEREIETVKG